MVPSLIPLSPRHRIIMLIKEYEKQLQPAISSTIERMTNPTWPTSLANIGILTGNAQSDIFKAPRCCFENTPNTALTIVCTFNVSIDCNWIDVPNLPQKKNKLKLKTKILSCLVCVLFRIKLCAKMVITLRLEL